MMGKWIVPLLKLRTIIIPYSFDDQQIMLSGVVYHVAMGTSVKKGQRIDSANAYLPAHWEVFIRQLFEQQVPCKWMPAEKSAIQMQGHAHRKKMYSEPASTIG